jgi:hypothetical protein
MPPEKISAGDPVSSRVHEVDVDCEFIPSATTTSDVPAVPSPQVMNTRPVTTRDAAMPSLIFDLTALKPCAFTHDVAVPSAENRGPPVSVEMPTQVVDQLAVAHADCPPPPGNAFHRAPTDEGGGGGGGGAMPAPVPSLSPRSADSPRL